MTVHFEDIQGETQVPRFWAVLEFTNGDLFYVWARSCPTLCNPLDCSPLPALCCLTGCQLWAVCTQSCIQQIIVCAQSCVTLCNPMDCSPPGASVWNSSRQEYWSGLPFPTPGDLPDPGVEPVSLASSTLAGEFFTTAAAAKWLQLCPILCNPIDGSPPGSSVPGILQARTPEWGCQFLLQCMHAC